MRKKVLFMITKGNFGGAQRYVFDLATNISKEKYDIAVACGEGETLKEKLKNENIKVIEIPSLKRNINFAKDVFSLMEIIKILRDERPDVLHLNSSKMGLLGAFSGRLLRIPRIIFTGHAWAFNEERGVISKSAIAFLHWLTIILCHKTIAVSKRIEDQISKFPFVKRKVIHIYNGIVEIPIIEKDEARHTLSKNHPEALSSRLWIGTVSELHKNKGLDFLIKAFAEINRDFANTACVIIGEGEERERLSNLIKELGLEKRVFLFGFVKNAQKYLKAFDIFTLTSRTEAFPYAPLEAGMAELPVVASWIGGIPEQITNEESGILVQVGNTEEIKNALVKLIKDPEEAGILGKNLKEEVKTKFGLERSIAQTVNLY